MNKRVLVVIIGAAIIFGVAAVAIYTFVTALNKSDQVYSCVRNRTNNADIVTLLSSKSPYIYPIPGQISDNPPANGTCQVIQAWIVIRHGTRYPEKDFIKKSRDKLPFIRDNIIDAHEKRKGHLCEEDVAAIKDWTLSFNEPTAMVLAPQGKLEMENLGKRFRQRYPELFHQKAFQDSSMKVRYTDTERAKSSAAAFLYGSLQLGEAIELPETATSDPALRFYKTCRKWKDTVDENPESLKEQQEFKKSNYFTDLLQRVLNITGLSSENVTAETVVLLYKLCSYETAWSGGSSISPWCSIFTELDFRVLEYHQDLDYYWKDGYGNELNHQIACPTLHDLLENLKNKQENADFDPSVVLYFTHSGLLLKFGALMGLFKDDVSLKHDNFDTMQNRKWRSSSIDKFGTNLAIILHKCEDNDLEVQLLHQETPIPIPGCTDGRINSHLCPLKTFLSTYNSLVNNCNAEELCKI